MSRIVKSPSDIFPGTITLREPLGLEEVMAIEDALDAMSEILPESKFLKSIQSENGNNVNLNWTSRQDHIFLPAIRLCVEKWDLQNFPVTDTFFPSTPRKDSHNIIRAIWNELLLIYRGEQEIPNASSGTPISMQPEMEHPAKSD